MGLRRGRSGTTFRWPPPATSRTLPRSTVFRWLKGETDPHMKKFENICEKLDKALDLVRDRLAEAAHEDGAPAPHHSPAPASAPAVFVACSPPRVPAAGVFGRRAFSSLTARRPGDALFIARPAAPRRFACQKPPLYDLAPAQKGRRCLEWRRVKNASSQRDGAALPVGSMIGSPRPGPQALTSSLRGVPVGTITAYSQEQLDELTQRFRASERNYHIAAVMGNPKAGSAGAGIGCFAMAFDLTPPACIPSAPRDVLNPTR